MVTSLFLYFGEFVKITLAMVAALLGIGLGSCGDDEPFAPKPVGSSRVTMMHANPWDTGATEFRRDTVSLATLSYGATSESLVPNSSAIVTMRGADGAERGSVAMRPDSSASVWVIYGGTETQRDAYQIRTWKIKPIAGNVGLRVIHASGGTPELRVRLNSATGTPVTPEALSYRSATPYIDLPAASTSNLVAVTDTATALMTIPVAGQFQAGSLYTVVIYGPAPALAYRIVKDE